jgi:hypothetical protein
MRCWGVYDEKVNSCGCDAFDGAKGCGEGGGFDPERLGLGQV